MDEHLPGAGNSTMSEKFSKSFRRRRVKALFILLLLISIGLIYTFSINDKETNALLTARDSLNQKKDYYTFIEQQNLTRDLNLLRLDTNKYLLNIFKIGDSTLLVTNATTHHCEKGDINGCWTQETTAEENDVVAFQIRLHNSGQLPIKNLSISLSDSILTAQKSIIYKAHIFVRHKIITEGVALLQINNCKYWAMENHAWYHPSRFSDSVSFNGNNLLAPKSLTIDSLIAGQYMVIICRIRIQNRKQ